MQKAKQLCKHPTDRADPDADDKTFKMLHSFSGDKCMNWACAIRLSYNQNHNFMF